MLPRGACRAGTGRRRFRSVPGTGRFGVGVGAGGWPAAVAFRGGGRQGICEPSPGPFPTPTRRGAATESDKPSYASTMAPRTVQPELPPEAPPETFTCAVAGLCAGSPRPEITLEEVSAPQRLAPYAYALSGTGLRGGDEVATGRLILLHDPAGHQAWGGTPRPVPYVTAGMEPDPAA